MNIQIKLAIISAILFLVARTNIKACTRSTRENVRNFWAMAWFVTAAAMVVFGIWSIFTL